MNHQPFESWILDEIHLSLEQETTLQAHLATCTECRKVHHGWHATRRILQASRVVRPAPGFSQRFATSMAEYRARKEHQKQVRNLILGLSLSLIATAALLIVVIFSVNSPVDFLVRTTEVITSMIGWYNRASRALIASLQQPVVLAVWILLTSGISLLAFGWLFTLWRISLQGVEQK